MSEDGSAYKIEKAICCSVNTFLCSNYIWGLLSVGMLVVGLVGVSLSGGVLLVLPPQAYFTFLAFGGYSVLVICAGIFGQKSRVELCFLFYVLFMALGLIAQTLGYCFLLLYAHDVATIQSLDGAAIDAQNTLEDHLLKFALDQPEDWKTTQDALDCCGVDFEAGIELADAAALETGDNCFGAAEQAELAALRGDVVSLQDPNNFDEFQNFIPARDSQIVGFETEFFCKSKISALIDQFTPLIGALIALLLLLQLIALVSASRLYWVPEFLGGWQFDDEELELVAERKGIPLPKQSPNNGGNRVLSTLREQTNRLSFRIKNAYTADPEIPQSAGFLNRLSLKRNALSGHGSFNGANDNDAGLKTFNPQPPSMPPQANSTRNMFNRISQRLFTHSLIDMNPPPGLPPSSPATFRPSQPTAPPNDLGASGRSRLQRMSQKLTQGFQSVQSSFGNVVRAPPQPPQPPQAFHRTGNSNPAPMNGFTDPRASNLSNGGGGPPPPNSFMTQRQMSNPTLALSPPGMSAFNPPSVPSTPVYNPPQVVATPSYNPPVVASSPAFTTPPVASNQPPRKTSAAATSAQKPSTRVAPKKSSTNAAGGGGGGARGGLLAQIQMGKALKPTVTVDKSAPKI